MPRHGTNFLNAERKPVETDSYCIYFGKELDFYDWYLLKKFLSLNPGKRIDTSE